MFEAISHHRAALLIFISFFILFLIISFSATPLATPYDPYYHLKHAQTYWSGEAMNMPVFSSINYPGADLYVGYHLLLAPFTFAFNGDNYIALLAGSKIFHAIADATIFLTFYYVVKYVLQRLTKGDVAISASRLALFSTLFLFVASANFTSRLLYQRPHLISIIFLLLGYYFIIKKKHLSLFIVAALFPLFYSISFIIIVPALIYTICHWFYHRPRRLSSKAYYPLLVTLLGLTTGILLHPQPLLYLYNAYYVHLLALVNVYTGATFEGAEIYPFTTFTTLLNELLWLLPFLIVMCHYAFTHLTHKKISSTFSLEKLHLFALTSSFFLVAMFYQRAVEYLIPFVVLLLTWVTVEDLIPAYQKIKPLLTKVQANLLQKIPLVILVVSFVVLNIRAVLYMQTRLPFDRYQSAVEFISDNSSPGDIVFHQTFSHYPQFVFFNNQNRYIMGMGSVFTYVKYPEKIWLRHHLITKGQACSQKTCRPEDIRDIHEAINQEFKAKFILYDASIVDGERSKDNNKFQEALENDSRFTKIFIDEKDPDIMVYSL